MHGVGLADGSLKALEAEVESATQDGSRRLQDGQKEEALGLFQLAYNKAQQLTDAPYIKRSCAFNLGAVHIALGQPEKGIKSLEKALPPPNKKDGKSNGDLFYNFGLGYEALQKHVEAARYYELALEEYQLEKDNVTMEAEVSAKTGECYVRTSQWLQAARCFGLGALAYSKVNNKPQEAQCRCRQASSLHNGKRVTEACNAADQCMILCQKVANGKMLGRLYNELGLTYTQCHEFAKAAMCFELALPSSRGPEAERKQEAVILQNLGAVYNSLGDYQRAVQFHRKAAALHAHLGNRNSQGQCFANLAFAYSQLGEQDHAGEFYLHALQAAKDTDDLRGQWQAMEGLGAVAFNDGETEKAAKHFKQALATLSKCEENKVAKERILTKLSDALGSDANSELSAPPYAAGLPSAPRAINPVRVLLNDRPRPPSRQELLQIQYMRRQRELYKERMRQEFDPIALGLGAYDELSDSSLSDRRDVLPRRRRRRRSSDESDSDMGRFFSDPDGWEARTRPTTARGSRGDRRRLAAADETASEPGTRSPLPPAARPPSKKTSVSQRRFQGGADQFAVRRKQKRPLLRVDGHDSEEEWRENMREVRSESSEAEYRERLRPQTPRSSGSEREGRRGSITSFRAEVRNLLRRAFSDDGGGGQRKIHRPNRQRFAGDVGQGRPKARPRSAKRDAHDLDAQDERNVDEMIEAVADEIVDKMTEQDADSNKRKQTDEDRGGKTHSTIEEEADDDEESDSSSEKKGDTQEATEETDESEKERQMKAYEEMLRRKRMAKAANSDELNSSVPRTAAPAPPLCSRTAAPAPPLGSRTAAPAPPLRSTYEVPVRRAAAANPSKAPGEENFFRAGSSEVEGAGSLARTAQGHTGNATLTRTGETEDEPLYQTIRSAAGTAPRPAPGSPTRPAPQPGPSARPAPSSPTRPDDDIRSPSRRREDPGDDHRDEANDAVVSEKRKNSSRICVVL